MLKTNFSHVELIMSNLENISLKRRKRPTRKQRTTSDIDKHKRNHLIKFDKNFLVIISGTYKRLQRQEIQHQSIPKDKLIRQKEL